PSRFVYHRHSSLFSSLYRHHPHPPSFPTRRSSDLSGSDLKSSVITERLRNLGATIYEGHRAEQVRGAHVVVISSAVRPDNPEIRDRKSTRLNSSHQIISYAVFCLKKKSNCQIGTHI